MLATGGVMSVTDDPSFQSYSDDEELRVIV
jgi:hypothetical protein